MTKYAKIRNNKVSFLSRYVMKQILCFLSISCDRPEQICKCIQILALIITIYLLSAAVLRLNIMFTYGIVFATVVRQSFPGIVEHKQVLSAHVVDTFLAVRIELRRSGTAAHHHASFRGDRLLAQHSHL